MMQCFWAKFIKLEKECEGAFEYMRVREKMIKQSRVQGHIN